MVKVVYRSRAWACFVDLWWCRVCMTCRAGSGCWGCMPNAGYARLACCGAWEVVDLVCMQVDPGKILSRWTLYMKCATVHGLLRCMQACAEHGSSAAAHGSALQGVQQCACCCSGAVVLRKILGKLRCATAGTACLHGSWIHPDIGRASTHSVMLEANYLRALINAGTDQGGQLGLDLLHLHDVLHRGTCKIHQPV